MKFMLMPIAVCISLTACVGTRDLTKLNRDPQCLYLSDVLFENRRTDNSEVYVKTLSFDDREFIEVYNKAGLSLGFRDIYGSELTNADLEAIGPYTSDVNSSALRSWTWKFKREQFLKFPERFPKSGQPYKALLRPAFCDLPVVPGK